MTICELNEYLTKNIKVKYGDYLSSAPFIDEYDYYRRDANIYCYSAMISVVERVTNSSDYRQYILCTAKQLRMSCGADENRSKFLRQVFCDIYNDGDDFLDEQSVGWYLGVQIYTHCLAYDSIEFEELFLQYWKKYYSVGYQREIYYMSCSRIWDKMQY